MGNEFYKKEKLTWTEPSKYKAKQFQRIKI